ncbi:MAG: hypothetical protein M0Z33_07455 [Actinomycetota bacterium]|nr:hypothetical protein [Actinomycetota bacterium]
MDGGRDGGGRPIRALGALALSCALASGVAVPLVLVPATASAASGAARSAHAASRAVVDVAARGKLGRVLVDGSGMTLYHFTADSVHHLACTGKCLSIWPPLYLAKGQRAALAGKGVSGLGTVARPGGKRQVTYHGEPLYEYSGDTKAGQTRGEGILGAWFAVKLAAAKPTHAASSGGYGY